MQVHINSHIPPAIRCGDLVTNYKQLCRSRQIYLNTPDAERSAVIDEDTDVFLIDDD